MADGKAFRLKDRSGLAEHGMALLVGEASPRARPSQLALPGDPADSFWKRLKGMGRACSSGMVVCLRARVSLVPCEKMSLSFGSPNSAAWRVRFTARNDMRELRHEAAGTRISRSSLLLPVP